MSDADQNVVLAEWTARLSEALALEGLDVDVDAVLRLASVAAHSVIRPAAPLTTFLVGYAAGLAVGERRLAPDAAIEAASATARELAETAPDGPDASSAAAGER